MNEKQMHEIVIAKVPEMGLLKLADDKFSRFDAEHNRCIVEYKARRKFYDKSTQIEKDKLEANMRIAEEKGKLFFYVVFDGYDSIHLFNISKLVNEGYDFNWTFRQCPATSDFENRQYIEKHVGEITWDKAVRVLKGKRNDDKKKREASSLNNYSDHIDPYNCGL